MPIGFCHAPEPFEHLIEFYLGRPIHQAYLVDVIVVNQTFQEQLDKLRKMFQRFWGAHLKLNPVN
jgi:hypothetical protein